jgi:hypothetical protein
MRILADTRAGRASVVVPHRGQARLPHLAATLPGLRMLPGVGEVIVVELGASPHAEPIARAWADRYVFSRHAGPFDRARALNMATPFARHELIFWKDNDLILSDRFLDRAAAELRARGLDFLVPYTSIRYLSERDSMAVMRESRSPADCVPANVYFSRLAISGGAGLVRRSFVERHGGMPEGFRGWGGEDEAWTYKAYLLGRAGYTLLEDQHLYHLYHPLSGGYGRRAPVTSAADYVHNLTLLNRIMSVRESSRFAERFGPATPPCPWDEDARIVFVSDPARSALADRVAESLEELYGRSVESLRLAANDSAAAGLHRAGGAAAIVLFGGLAERIASSGLDPQLARRMVALYDAGHSFTHGRAGLAAPFGAVVAADPLQARLLGDAGLRPWPGFPEPPSCLALSLVPPIALVAGSAAAGLRDSGDASAGASSAGAAAADGEYGRAPRPLSRTEQWRAAEPALVRLLASYASSRRYWTSMAGAAPPAGGGRGRDRARSTRQEALRAAQLAERFDRLRLRIIDWLAGARHARTPDAVRPRIGPRRRLERAVP